MLLEVNTQRQEGKYYILKLLLHSVNAVVILYKTDNIQSAILLSLVTSGLQSTHPLMPCYISPNVVYNIYGCDRIMYKTGFVLVYYHMIDMKDWQWHMKS